jgi:RNA polymerase sigma-70 factor (ECF subfamily)
MTFPARDTLIPTRQSLLSRLRDWGDEESWRDFFETYWRLIYRVGIKAGLSEAEAQDVVQETLIAVARNIKDFKYDRKRGSFKGWLLTTTHWRVADAKRKRARAGEVGRVRADDTTGGEMVAAIADPAANPLEAVWDEEWSNNLLEAAEENIKRQVKPKQYQAFDYFVLKKVSMKEVTRRLGMTLGQVYYASYRVSALMKKEVRRLEKKLV